ncbi:MAG: hypothetical protein FD171_684 [Actinobacteria bacterium]|nr:MAG: hypothetical protein FD171_684 [Actinomycetota bacterium]
MQSFWEEHKGLIIGLMIAATVVSMFIPVRLGTGHLLEHYEEGKNEIANVTLVEKTKDSAIFEVLATPQNYYVAVSISLDDVEIGSRGCVAKTGGLKLDGSYEHDHDFLFARRGSLFQALIGYYYPPYHGHVEGRVDPADTASSVPGPADESSGAGEYHSQVDPIMTAAKVSISTIDESIAKRTNGDTPSTTELHRAGEQLRAAADALSRLSPSAEDAELHAELIAMYHAYGSGALEMEAALKNQSAQAWERVNDLMAEGNRHSAAIEKIAKARGLVP